MQVCPLPFIHFTTQRSDVLTGECYNYILVVVFQTCRFQKRGDIWKRWFAEPSIWFHTASALTDKPKLVVVWAELASGWHKANGCKLSYSRFSKDFSSSRVPRGAPDTLLLWLLSVHARSIQARFTVSLNHSLRCAG